jgi:transcriptional regulator with XRE-family HTH domain
MTQNCYKMSREMSSTLGQLLRQLRKARRLTLQQAADVAHLSRSTVNRWETGVHQPCLTELQSLLEALGANGQQKKAILAQIDAPRASSLIRQSLTQLADKIGIGPQPHGGDLLRALRLQRGFALEEVAKKIGVTPRTIRRWENGEVCPSHEQLHHYCYCVGAGEEEMLALTCGNVASCPQAGQDSPDVLAEQLDHLKAQDPRLPLVELRLLALEAQAWRLAVQSDAGQDLLARIYVTQADNLSVWQRWKEVGVYAGRTLDLMHSVNVPRWCHIVAGLAYAHSAVYRSERPSPRRGLEELRFWEGTATTPINQAWVSSRRAEYLVLAGESDLGIAAAEKACQIVEAHEHPREIRQRRLDKALLMQRAGRHREALDVLTVDAQADAHHRAFVALSRAGSLLALQETLEAQNQLTEGWSIITQHSLSYLRDWAETLMQQSVSN